MGRPSKHRIVKPHPSPRFRDNVRLQQFVRGPTDDKWYAQYLIEGVWSPPNNPASLGTNDWDEACERARDKFTGAVAGGQPVVTPRAPIVKPVEHPFRQFAEAAIATLDAERIDAEKVHPGKGHKFLDLTRRIKADLLPKWGELPIPSITEHMLNDWVQDEYRVEDKAATVAKYGRQKTTAVRQKVMKKPSLTTLGNLDWAFKHVWDEAVKARVVDRRNRPMIDKTEHGEDGEARPFIDADAVTKLAALMTDGWIQRGNNHYDHTPDYKRLLRAYIALAATTGIRPGLELKRVKIGNVQFRTQHGHDVMIVQVVKNQGKHKRARPVVVYQGDAFDIRHILIDLIAWQRAQGRSDRDDLFGWCEGAAPVFRPGIRHVLEHIGCLIDPDTGKERVAYSFRHYFATKLIENGLSILQIAEWLGTSATMIEHHYNRFLTERTAHLVDGRAERIKRETITDEDGSRWRWDEKAGEMDMTY